MLDNFGLKNSQKLIPGDVVAQVLQEPDQGWKFEVVPLFQAPGGQDGSKAHC